MQIYNMLTNKKTVAIKIINSCLKTNVIPSCQAARKEQILKTKLWLFKVMEVATMSKIP